MRAHHWEKLGESRNQAFDPPRPEDNVWLVFQCDGCHEELIVIDKIDLMTPEQVAATVAAGIPEEMKRLGVPDDCDESMVKRIMER